MSQLPDSLVVVRGGGLVLRDFREADFDRLRVAFADPDVKAWNPGADDADGAGVAAPDRPRPAQQRDRLLGLA